MNTQIPKPGEPVKKVKMPTPAEAAKQGAVERMRSQSLGAAMGSNSAERQTPARQSKTIDERQVPRVSELKTGPGKVRMPAPTLAAAMGARDRAEQIQEQEKGREKEGMGGRERPTDPGFYVGSAAGSGALEELRDKQRRRSMGRSL